MRNGQSISTYGQWAWVVVAGVTLALLTPFTPLVVGAIELSFFNTHAAAEWLRTTAVEETIVEFYRELGWVL